MQDKSPAAKVEELMAFAVPFATALARMRDAAKANQSVTLTSEEVKQVLEGIRVLNKGAAG